MIHAGHDVVAACFQARRGASAANGLLEFACIGDDAFGFEQGGDAAGGRTGGNLDRLFEPFDDGGPGGDGTDPVGEALCEAVTHGGDQHDRDQGCRNARHRQVPRPVGWLGWRWFLDDVLDDLAVAHDGSAPVASR